MCFFLPQITIFIVVSISFIFSFLLCVHMCVCMCMCACGKAVVLPVFHKIIINKDDANFYCNLNRYLIFYKKIDIKVHFGEF